MLIHMTHSTLMHRQEKAVVACSALKRKYRDILANSDKGEAHVKDIAFVSSRLFALSSSCKCSSAMTSFVH